MSEEIEEIEEQEPKAKKVKYTASEKDGNVPDKLLSFSEFAVERVLCRKPENKLITLLGKFTGSRENGVLVVEKQPITEDSVRGLLSTDAKVTSKFHNDIYSQYVVNCPCGLGEVRVTGVHPASDSHIAKYSDQKFHLVQETPHLYQSITKPFIENQAFTLDVSNF